MSTRFRGLSIDENSKGEMQYGYLIEDGEQAFIINEVIEATEEYINIGYWCPIDPKTIGHSTGVKDSNEKEIFEGDILGIETMSSIVYVIVFWDSEHALFMIKSEDYNDKEALAELFEDYTYPFYVIGNIYENGKLLEVKKND